MKQTSNLYFIYIALFISMGAFMPYNTIYLQEVKHFSGQEIGLLYSLSALSVAVIVPILGYLADYLKNVKLIVIIASIVTIVLMIPYTFIMPFYQVLLIYIIAHSFRSCIMPLIDSMSLTFSKQNNKNYGVYRACGSLAFIVGSIGTGLLLNNYLNVQQLFIYIHVIFLLILIIFISKQEIVVEEKKKNYSFKKDVKLLLVNKKFILILFIISIGNAIGQLSQTYISLSINDLDGDKSIIGLSFFFQVIPEVILIAVVLRFLKKLSHSQLIIIGFLLTMIRWIILLYTNSITVLLLALTSHGFLVAFVLIVGLDLISRLVKGDLLASAITLYTAVSNIVFAILSYISGYIIESFNLKGSYIMYILLCILSILLIIWYDIKYHKEGV